MLKTTLIVLLKPHNILKNLLYLLTVVTCFSCYNDSEEFLYPDLNANICTSDSSTIVTFNDQVSSTLNYYCLSCHNNSTADNQGDGIRLETYTQVKRKAEDGSLLGSIEHLSNYKSMPKNAGKLSNCEIEEIRKWIKNGYAEK